MRTLDWNSIHRDQPATYRIEVQGTLNPSWAETFGDLQIEHQPGNHGGTITRLTGEVADQAALAGVLNLTFMLGMPLISVSCLATHKRP